MLKICHFAALFYANNNTKRIMLLCCSYLHNHNNNKSLTCVIIKLQESKFSVYREHHYILHHLITYLLVMKAANSNVTALQQLSVNTVNAWHVSAQLLHCASTLTNLVEILVYSV